MNLTGLIWLDPVTRTVITDPQHIAAHARRLHPAGQWVSLIPLAPFASPGPGNSPVCGRADSPPTQGRPHGSPAATPGGGSSTPASGADLRPEADPRPPANETTRTNGSEREYPPCPSSN